MKLKGKSKVRMDADYKDLARHTITLEREARIDTSERKGVVESVVSERN